MSGISVSPFSPRRELRGRNPYQGHLPQVAYQHSAFDVHHALMSGQAQSNPAYAFAVLKSYCDLKYARGKSKHDIREKIHYLEQEIRWRGPQYQRAFDEVREYYLLGPTTIVAPVRAGTMAARPPPPTSVTRVQTTAGTTRRPSAASQRPAVNRVEADGDEPPPPPYSTSDPEPEATAVLLAMQRAESNSSSVSSIFQHRRTQSDVASATSGTADPPRSNDFPASPAQRAGTLAPPNGRPRSDISVTSAPASSVPERPTTPLDPQERRIREESELEEAMRLSRQSEKERLEYERAVQASLATLEEDTALRSIQEEDAPGAGPSSRPDDGRRASSYHPPTNGTTAAMQRAASASNTPQRNGGYGYGYSEAGPSSAGPSRSSNLMDEFESLDMNDAPLLTPTHTGAPTVTSPLYAQGTGMQLQSKNPFLSDAERELLSLHKVSPSAVERDLPALPTEEQYAAPDGPPPGWTPPALPARQNEEYSAPPVPPLPPRTSTIHTPVTSPSRTHHSPSTSTSGGVLGGSSFINPPKHSPSPQPIIIGGENALEMLREYDTVFLIDDSTSMAGERWEQAKMAIMGVVVQAVRYDEDGIDVYFLNSKRVGRGLRTMDDVEELFAGLDPKGATPTGLRMEGILREYMARLERATAEAEASGGHSSDSVRSMNLIVVTDGAFAVPVIRRLRSAATLDDRLEFLSSAPTDDPESVLTSIAKRLDRGDYPLSQVGVQLLQIGDDADATEALQELDEGLAAAHGVRDMVDTVPYNGEAMSAQLIVKVLLGGINRRIDRKFTA